MSPEERQLLAGLFDRVRGQSNVPRDGEAEAFIADVVRTQPYAPYLLAQSVIVQEAALRAANDKLQQLEAQVQDLQRSQPPQQPAGGGSFLGSLFGGGNPPPPLPPRPSAVPPGGPWQQPQQGYSQPYPPQAPQGGPWGAAPMGGGLMGGAPAGGGGGFLKGALGAAAGVAGGVLLADSIRGLFGAHNNPLGMGTGFADMGGAGLGGLGGTGGETVVNNYYGNDGASSGNVQDADYSTDGGADFADNSGDFGGSDDSGSYDV